MNVKEAKDFLVGQVEQQATMENVPLCELEKRMKYFTEGPDATENPIALNEEFEKQFETSEYETEIASLLRHAHKRAKQNDEQEAGIWKESVNKLKAGDHRYEMSSLKMPVHHQSINESVFGMLKDSWQSANDLES